MYPFPAERQHGICKDNIPHDVCYSTMNLLDTSCSVVLHQMKTNLDPMQAGWEQWPQRDRRALIPYSAFENVYVCGEKQAHQYI